MTTTSYLKLQKPPFDTIPWDDAINGNMDIIDAYVSKFMSVPNFVGVWQNSTSYVAGQSLLDASNGLIYVAQVTHTSAAAPTTFAQDRTNNPTYWVASGQGQLPAGYAPLNSPAFTGIPTAPTAVADTNTTQLATTAMVLGQASAVTPQQDNVAAIGTSTRFARADHVHQASANIGKNKLHNPLFNIQQRGPGPFTTNGAYTADRWVVGVVTDTISVTPTGLIDADRTAIGDEEAAFTLQNTFSGSAAAGACNYLMQRIENVRRLAGKTVTISFWAKAGSGTPKLGVNVLQNFGTGGSPSASVQALATGNAATLSTTWQRYNTTIAIPSIVGKTLGSNNDSSTGIQFWYSSGATNNAIAGNIGVQSATIALWGMQVEVGSVATPLEKPDPRFDLSNCQRFFQVGLGNLIDYGYGGAGNGVIRVFLLPVRMRATPSLVNYNFSTSGNINTFSVISNNADSIAMQFTVTALGGYSAQAAWNATADL